MSNFRTLSRNIASNWFGYAVQVAITFMLTPFVLREIGDARYGVWAIVVSINGYYGLLDMGCRAGMTQYITRYYSVGDFSRMRMAASSGLALHAVCALFVAICTALAVFVTPAFFSFSPAVESEMSWCILIVGGSTAVQFVLYPFSAALTATQRFGVINAIGVFSRLLAGAATVLFLKAGYGLIGLCVATTIANTVDYVLRSFLATRLIPQLRFSMRLVTRSSIRECLAFGVWSAIISISSMVIGFTDALVIGAFMPASAVAFFVLANNLIRYFSNLFAPIGHVFFPAATSLDAKNDLDTLRRLYLTASRMIALAAVGVASIAYFWSADFYFLWLGGDYLTSDAYHNVPLLFRVLLAGAVCAAAQRIGSKVLLGRRRVRGLALLFICEGTLNLGLSMLLIGPYGLLGVALGTMIPAVLCQGIMHPILVCSDLNLGRRDYVQAVLRPVAMVTCLLGPLLFGLHQSTGYRTWTAFAVEGVAASLVALLVIASFGLTRSDRERYLYPFILRFLKHAVFCTRSTSTDTNTSSRLQERSQISPQPAERLTATQRPPFRAMDSRAQ